ncbi:hypothetical protein K461DRAFT_3958 [Myriangium duriaei CBS 260.36]|uniref:Uncharacterized protein n=1 Tax=Myriangium duriaei CBS 260.36 TaxID=1168546 RepID=A0A9P4JDC0_9PEZI|nr:hypothetical protein K461DRAFT_3958 [Myriangium duriaei CBS 260.36]
MCLPQALFLGEKHLSAAVDPAPVEQCGRQPPLGQERPGWAGDERDAPPIRQAHWSEMGKGGAGGGGGGVGGCAATGIIYCEVRFVILSIRVMSAICYFYLRPRPSFRGWQQLRDGETWVQTLEYADSRPSASGHSIETMLFDGRGWELHAWALCKRRVL